MPASGDRARKLSLAAGLASLAALAWAIASYRPLPAVAAAILAVLLLTIAARRKRACFLVLSGVSGLLLWAAFCTIPGYFWLNRHRLEALAAEIAAVPAIISLQLGQEDRRSERVEGRPATFDSYRFINGVAVTHHREQVAPEAHQPVFHVDDLLRRLDVPAARYRAIRAALERLSLSGYSRGPGDQIMLDEPVMGGTPWGFSYVFSPSGVVLRATNWQEFRRLTPRWYFVGWG